MTAIERHDAENGESHARRMDSMYRHQRHIYDLTRKYYLLGRDGLVRDLAAPAGASILEVGCGTGRNLALIARHHPQARLFGLDISAEMLATASRKLSALGSSKPVLKVADATGFTPADFGEQGFDRIVISYALSMIPAWENAVEAALDALDPGGSLHVVDFGQQERLPPAFGRMLKAWLARFHVTPRPDLLSVMTAAGERRGATTKTRLVGRGYAWQAVVQL